MSVVQQMLDTSSQDQAGANDRQQSYIPGEFGIWLFVLADMLLEFATIFGYFLSARASEPALFAQSRANLSQILGLVNTLLLLTSSMFVALAVQSLRSGDRAGAARQFIWARGLGLGFVAVKILEYGKDFLVGLTPMTNAFYMYYFAATGLAPSPCSDRYYPAELCRKRRQQPPASHKRDSIGRVRSHILAHGGSCLGHPLSASLFGILNMLLNIRNPIIRVWLGLVCVTILSWLIGMRHGFLLGTIPQFGMALVLAIAFSKTYFIGGFFMEVRTAPLPLRLAFNGWVTCVGAAIILIYLFA